MAIANIENTPIVCSGDIQIHWIKAHQAYVTWKLFNNKKLIASKSERYFFLDDAELELVIKELIKRIENYRIGREKIFSEVRISQ